MHVLILGDSFALPRPRHVREYNPADAEPLAVTFRQTYGALLSDWLTAKYPERHSIVTNRAVRSTTIVQINDQFGDQLFFMEPDVIILHVGLVDCWPRQDNDGLPLISSAEFEFKLKNCIRTLSLRPHTRLIIVGISPCAAYLEENSPGILNSIELYNSILKKVVDNRQISFVDMAVHIDPHQPDTYLHSDGQHLNPEGNNLVFQKTSALITNFIENGVNSITSSPSPTPSL